MQESLSEIEQLGGSVIGISPITAAKNTELHEHLKLTFTLATDHGNKIASEFGLVFTLPDSLKPIYSNFGIDIAVANNDESFTLPVPATYVIDQKGIIRHAYINADYTERLDPTEIITALQSMK